MRKGLLALALLLAVPLSAQKPLFTTAIPPAEFAARRAAVMRTIGDGVAILQGATERPVYKAFRQSAQFFYLTGVEVPPIKPHVAPRVVLADAHRKMTEVMKTFTFADPKVRAAAERFVTGYASTTRNSLGHWIGMEVHDVTAPYETLEPGMMFTIEPALTIPDERIYIRLEDAIVITANGYENMSGFVPFDIDGVERIMREEPKYVKAR